MRSEKPICAPPRLSEVSPTLPLKTIEKRDKNKNRLRAVFFPPSRLMKIWFVKTRRLKIARIRPWALPFCIRRSVSVALRTICVCGVTNDLCLWRHERSVSVPTRHKAHAAHHEPAFFSALSPRGSLSDIRGRKVLLLHLNVDKTIVQSLQMEAFAHFLPF